MFTTKAHADDLRAQIVRLEKQLEEERAERSRLLDRLLERHNFAPLAEPPKVSAAPPMQIISPFGGGATPEMIDAMKQSFVDEEIAYLQAEHAMTPEQAREKAEREWLTRHNI
jgi:hypothetical protein